MCAVISLLFGKAGSRPYVVRTGCPEVKRAERKAARSRLDYSFDAVVRGTSNTQNEPPWLTCLVWSAMSPPQSGTAPP